jgi:kynurenine formamidase
MAIISGLSATVTFDLTLPITPGGPNVNCYYAEDVQEQTIEAGTFIGSVARGGSVNYRKLSVTPHGSTTHTECYGHISDDPQATLYHCYQGLIQEALLVSLPVERLPNGDRVITLSAVRSAWQSYLDKSPKGSSNNNVNALVIRTLPNGDTKCNAQHSGKNPVYPEPGIGRFLAEIGIQHWLIDLPSVDRELDGGVLANHNGFWQTDLAQLSPYKNVAADGRKNATITELIFVPDVVADGSYSLVLAPMALLSDAAPSRVLLLKA